MAPSAQRHRAGSMIPIDKRPISSEILKDSAIAHIAQAYFSIAKRLEQKTGCSATRGFILSTLRGGAALNQNQIAKLLGFDRTVVHRAIKGMIREGLLTERKADSGRALLLHLTAKGNEYRNHLIKERRAVDEKLSKVLKPNEISILIRLLDIAAALEI
jgi:DNA-binding MarR family transcriptional regulator